MRKLDLVGNRFERLVVTEFVGTKGGKRRWKCLCDCGNERILPTDALRNGNTKSCGCLHVDRTKSAHTRHGASVGGKRNRIYQIYHNMTQRCTNRNNNDYKYYGGRGIIVCQEWLKGFEMFRDWALSHGYQGGLEIDRIDSNGNYCPENCRFVSRAIQCRNQGLRCDNKFGAKGIFRTRNGRYRVTINVNRKRKACGTYDTLQEAIEARLSAEQHYWGENYGIQERKKL